MEDINLKVEGIVLTEEMKKQIIDQLYSVFGFNKYRIRKLDIKISKSNIDKFLCELKIYFENRPMIAVELKSHNIDLAISLSIERAHLKYAHNISSERFNRQLITDHYL